VPDAPPSPHRLTRALAGAPPAAFAAYAVTAAFTTYFCMYAYRKPFSVAVYAGQVDVLGVLLDAKVVLLTAQVLGYALSKFMGIKVISEMTPDRRAWAILGTIGASWAALLLFAVLPSPYNALAMFLNGIPLGMVWGLVFGFLEGRRLSEVLGAGLSASYIVASGAVKSVGKLLLDAGVSEAWMPFAAGGAFALPLGAAVWMLARLPPPTAEDEAARTRRAPMDGESRRAFLKAWGPGVLPLTVLYVLLTAYRDFRDNFARELWDGLGYGEAPAVFAAAELPIAAAVLVVLALLALISDNRRALIAVHLVMLSGTALVGLSTLAWQLGWIGPAAWMVSVGLGLYVAYVPYGCVLFDRLLSAVGAVGTAGFLIYMTDAFGYAGSVGLMLYKNLGQPALSWVEFFTAFSYATAVVCSGLYAVSLMWFAARTRPSALPQPGPTARG